MKTIAHIFIAATLLVFSSAAFTQAGTPSDKGASSRNTTVTIEPVLDSGNISYAPAWRIALSKQAESDGQIIFRMIRKDNATNATKISIAVAKGTIKADLVKIIEDALQSNVPTGVKVERNPNDEISISDATGISITLESNTIADLGIALLQE
ncbi:MAG: hypothetical protein ACREO1_06940 [Arenimonas sp.]